MYLVCNFREYSVQICSFLSILLSQTLKLYLFLKRRTNVYYSVTCIFVCQFMKSAEKALVWIKVQLHAFLVSALESYYWSASRPGLFASGKQTFCSTRRKDQHRICEARRDAFHSFRVNQKPGTYSSHCVSQQLAQLVLSRRYPLKMSTYFQIRWKSLANGSAGAIVFPGNDWQQHRTFCVLSNLCDIDSQILHFLLLNNNNNNNK